MSIATLFKRKREIQLEKNKPIRQRYLDLVKSLALGDEIDSDELFLITDSMAIEEHRLEKDVDTMQQRIQAAANRQMSLDAAAEYDRLSIESEKLQAERNTFYARWQPKCNAIGDAIKNAESQLGLRSIAEQKLLATVIDPEIIDAQAELDKRREVLAARMRRCEQELSTANSRVSYVRATVENVVLDVSRRVEFAHPAREDNMKKYDVSRVVKAEQKIEEAESVARIANERYQRVLGDMRSLDREQAALNERKLTP